MGLEEEVTRFVDEVLPSDAGEWCSQFSQDKIIHDSLWGTFKLHRHEVALLDTPLLQRLRYLHQTGAVYLTYPSAHHTRFEHTLGVLCQTGRLCTALRESGESSRISESVVHNLRWAALLHDTGHGPFSHTSEQFFAGLPAVTEYRRSNPLLDDSGAGEILSYLIVRSQKFREFTRAVNSHFRVQLDCDEIAGAITGTLGPEKMYVSEIIHGPFDADKLDYMPRDGMFSGLKMHVDVDRLFHSIVIKDAQVGDVDQTRIAGKLSGLSPLTQILFNKMLLYTGMYHHHKVRAVDCMLWAIFDRARRHNTTVGDVKLESPCDFLRVTDDRLLVEELSDDDGIKKIIRDIRNRRLWRKCLVIARNTVPDEMHCNAEDDPAERFAGVALLAGDDEYKIQERREIADEIWKEAGEPCEKHEVWLDVPRLPGMTEAKKLWIDAPGQSQPQTLEDFVPIKPWVELYGTHQARSHVFCPREAAVSVGQAAEKVFDRRFSLKFLPQARAYSRLQ